MDSPSGQAPGETPVQDTRKLTRRRLAGAALLLSACAIAAIVLFGGGRGKGDTPMAGLLPGETTAEVTRRTLTESSTVDGTLGFGATLELYDRLAGTFTWLPSVGATIARGGTLFRIDDLPVVLMYGSVPAYRALKENVSDGPDVEQLNKNLIDLGYDPYGAIDDDSYFGAATAAAVRRWQKAEGLPETGEVELGRVVFAPSARRVTSVHVTLGQDPPPQAEDPNSNGQGEPGREGQPAEGSPKTEDEPKQAGEPKKRHAPKQAGKPRGEDRPKKAKDEPKEATKPKAGHKPQGQSKPKEEGSSHEDSPNEPGGSGAAAPEVVLTTTSSQQLVQLKLKAEQQQLAHIGEQAPVTLPGGGIVRGTIVEVGTVASEAKSDEDEKSPGDGSGSPNEGSGESATIPVTLALTHRVPNLDEAPVSVELVKSIHHNVLAVPATALVATAGGGYAIETPRPGGRRVAVAVTPGMFADGYVQIEGQNVHEGLAVIQSE